MEWIKWILVALMIGVMASLVIAMRNLTAKDPAQQKKLVVALTWRISLSFLIFFLIIALSYFEVIKPHTL